MSIDPQEKVGIKRGRIEKYILRKAFDDPENPYLPSNTLWRQKEQFDDGVGYSWTDSLKAYANDQVTDDEMSMAQKRFPEDTPTTKESYLYRKIFEQFFPNPVCQSTVKSWIAKTEWGCGDDSSGRVEKIHFAAYGKET